MQKAWYIGIGLIGVAVVGLCAAFVGWYMRDASARELEGRMRYMLAEVLPYVTSTQRLDVVDVSVPASPTRVLPSVFDIRGQSPLMSLVKVRGEGKSFEDRMIDEKEVLGRGFALTADGWLVVPTGVFGANGKGDVQVVWDGRTWPIEQAIRDDATGVVFVRIAARGLPVSALVRTSDVSRGQVVWIETHPGELVPESLLSVRASLGAGMVSSDRAARRFVLHASSALSKNAIGSVVWDEHGRAVGLIETVGERTLVLPTGQLMTSLDALLSSGVIRHATLGLKGTDLSGLVLYGARADMPTRGWLVRGGNVKGLQEGDVIQQIDRDILDGTADVGERLLEYRPGSVVMVSGMRKGQPFNTHVTLGSSVTGESLK